MISDPNYVLQAVHDLRSPLSALRILMTKGGQESELIGAIFQRIETISAELLDRTRKGRENGALATVIEDLLDEARVLAPHVAFTTTNFPADDSAAARTHRARKMPPDFARALSNLLSNAVSAGATRVQVDTRADATALTVHVLDNAGGAIPAHSAGLGLRQVRLFAKCAGGNVSYGPGRVTLTLPISAETDSRSRIRVL